MEELTNNYKNIKGWGIDADPKNEPTYPIKNYTGDDHKRLSYERPQQQPVDDEILMSNERPVMTATFGTSAPPSGVSGLIRRYAFKHSEGSMLHWMPLILADRVNAVEGVVEDIKNGFFPNVFKERGWAAEWKHDPKRLVTRAVIAIAVTATVIAILRSRSKRVALED